MRIRTIIFLYLAMVFAMPSLFATIQKREIIIINNDTLYTGETPLEMLFKNEQEKDSFLQKAGEKWSISTGCYKGYLGQWEIKNNVLFLTALYDCNERNPADLRAMFGDKYKNGKVEADWYSGAIYSTIDIPSLVSGIYRRIKEQEIFVTGGRVDSIANYDISKIQYSTYVDEPSHLKEYVYKRINWEKIPASVLNDTTRAGFLISGNEEGRIDSVQVLKSVNKDVDAQIVSILKTLPTWSVNYQRNKFDRVYRQVIILLDDRKRIQYSK